MQITFKALLLEWVGSKPLFHSMIVYWYDLQRLDGALEALNNAFGTQGCSTPVESSIDYVGDDEDTATVIDPDPQSTYEEEEQQPALTLFQI
jgi:hypothetical protein